MYRNRFRLMAAAAVCTTLALVTTQRPAAAEEPQTVTRTFALLAYCSPYSMDPPPVLSDFVGEDTVAILLKDLDYSWGFFLSFVEGCRPCDGYPVAGTDWQELSWQAVIVNEKTGPMAVCVLAPPGPRLPAHAVVVASRITEVHACWIKSICGLPRYDTQDDWDWNTLGAFIVVTAEFRVTNEN